MEAEFDKEMDALLRKAGKSGAATAPVFDSHLDADEISVFAENAAPEAAKARMIVHFSDCERCRTILSNLVALNSENPVAELLPSPVVSENKIEKTGWLAGLVSPRNLAFGLGALALLFAGFIGLGVIRNMSSGETQLAQADQQEIARPSAKSVESVADSNSANLALNEPASENSNSEGLTAGSADNSEPPLALAKNEATTGKDVARRQPVDTDGFSGSRSDLGRLRDSKDKRAEQEAPEELADAVVEKERVPVPKASASAPPPPQPSVLATRGAAVEKKKEDDESRLAANEAVTVDAAPAAGAAGAKRRISGKTFNRENGVWYDSAYRNQPTTRVIRGTAEYRSLDAGVRSISNQLPGTVVVVWKTKAYKIQ